MPVPAYTGPNVSTGNGVTTIFAYDFMILDEEDLVVEVDGVIQTSGYTVSGVGESGGGSVTFDIAPASGAEVLRYRARGLVRDTDYQRNGSFDEQTVDKDFDGLQMQVQQLSAAIARAFKAPRLVSADQVLVSSDWAGRHGMFLYFDVDGVLTVAAGTSGDDALVADVRKSLSAWYVDSAAGDDTVSGRNADAPLKTIAALLLKDIAPGDTIYLKCGSSWREKLTLPNDNITVEAYGNGADPILDGADVIANASFSKVGGLTNVYSVSVTTEAGNIAAATDHASVWEDGTRLTQASSAANCDSTPGTYYPNTSVTASPLTLYVHPTGSTNPTSDGKTYEYAKRSSCVDSFSVEHCVIRNITTKRPFQSYGSLTLGKFCKAYDCTADDGNKHNVFLREGARAYRVTANDSYNAESGGITTFVHYEDTATGEDVLYEDCTATQTLTPVGEEFGFYGHTGSGTFGTITYRRCTGTGLDNIFGGDDCSEIVIEDPKGTDFDKAIRPNVDTTVTGGSGSLTTARAAGKVVGFNAANTTIDITGLEASNTNTGGSLIECTLNGCTLNIYRNRFSWKSNLVTFSGAGGTLNSRGNQFIPLAGAARAYWLTGSPTLSSDGNDFGGITDASQPPFIIGSDSYASLEKYAAATGNDTNSVNGRTYRAEELVTYFDDFVGDALDARWNGRVGSDPQCAAPAIRADRINGEMVMTTGDDAAASMAVNGVQLETSLNWRPNMGGFVFEAKVSISVITSVALFVGLTDQNGALEMPFTLGAGDALTSNCTDGCGFLFDTAADTDEWCLVGVANNVDAAKEFLGIAPVANTMETLRIEVNATSGAATFFRNGVKVGSTMTGATRIGIAHTPVIAGFSRVNVSRSFFADYIKTQARRV